MAKEESYYPCLESFPIILTFTELFMLRLGTIFGGKIRLHFRPQGSTSAIVEPNQSLVVSHHVC